MAVQNEGARRTVATLLVVDDTLNVGRVFRTLATGRRMIHAPSATEARRTLETERVDMAIVDLWMPHEIGVSLLLHINERIEICRSS